MILSFGLVFNVAPHPAGTLWNSAMHTILTLNDDSNIAELISGGVQAAGFHSLYTTDSYQALSLLLNNPIDLLIQDIARRDIDVFQFYRLIKSEEQLRDIPMILFTGYPAVVTNVEGYMLLPIDLKKLPDTIKLTLQKCSRSLLTEKERAIRYQQLWSQPTW